MENRARQGAAMFKSYLIDAVQLASCIGEYLADIMEDASLLKVVDDLKTISTLKDEFNCSLLNVVLSAKPIDKVDYTSSVLTQSDYRVRPLSNEQYKTIS